MARTPAALGFRAHSGWAALVAVAGTPREPRVLDRRRVEIADPRIEGSLQPYHAAEPLPLVKVKRYLARCEDRGRRRAREAVGRVIDDLRAGGYEPKACGLLLSSARPLPPLAEVLASHALIHTADGEHFRDALREAAAAHGLALTEVKEKEIAARAAERLAIGAGELTSLVDALRKTVGSPWTVDQKLAAIAGWLALVGKSEGSKK